MPGRTPPKGLPIRAVTERGRDTSQDRDRLIPKHPIEGLRSREFSEEETTPVTMIKIVREELKDDIAAVDKKVEGVSAKVGSIDTSLDSAIRVVERLTGEVATTNKLLPVMLQTISNELQSKRTIDEHIVLTRTDVERHREITSINSTEADRAIKRKARLKLVSLLTSTSIATALITLIASRC